tara:strand:- start:1532 stop:2110 length:579 start_codon:yes stop_codon:yes gene_type:complete
MSSVNVTKDYIQFKDSSKQSGIFPMLGSIIMWSGDINSIPYGYLVCDGRTLDKTEVAANSIIEIYGTLFEKIGYKYGRVDGELNKFKIPDMRERFPLGITDNNFKEVVDSTSLAGGVKKLENSHFKHKHGLSTIGYITSMWSAHAISSDDEYDSYYGTQNSTSLFITPEPGVNDDFLTKFHVIVFLIKYKHI